MAEKTLLTEQVTVIRTETNFDKACDTGFRMAVDMFGIDEDGHSAKVPDWERSDSAIKLEFSGYCRHGSDHIYSFVAHAVKNVEDDYEQWHTPRSSS